MAIEQKELFEYLGIKEMPETIDAFRKSFDQSYIKKSPEVIKQDEDLYPKLLAERTGSIETKFRRRLKDLGVDLPKTETADMKAEEVIELGMKKLETVYSGKISELESQAGKGNDEKVNELKTQLEKAQTKYGDTKGLLESVTKEYELFKAEADSKIKGVKRQVKFGDAVKSIKWKSGTDDLKKKGFFAAFDEEHIVDIGDDDEVIVMDRNKKRLQSAKESGKFISLEEQLENFGRKLDVWETNPHAERGRVMPSNITQLGQPVPTPQNGAPVRRVAAAARNNEGR